MAIEIITVGGSSANTPNPPAAAPAPAKRSVMSAADAAEVRASEHYGEQTTEFAESLIAKGFKKNVVLTALEARSEELQDERTKEARQAARRFTAARQQHPFDGGR